VGLALWGCSDEGLDGGGNGDKVGNNAPTTVVGKFNAFLKKEMTGIYLWADEVREKAEYIPLDTNNQWYFDALKYTEDRWSRLTGEAFEGELADIDDGYDTGFGWTVTLWKVGSVFEAKLNHVYPHTPAAEAGLQRGDFITHVNGFTLSDASINQLFNTQTPITVRVKKRNGSVTESLSLTPRRFDIDPIAKDTVLARGGKRIGYLYYTSFVYKDDQSLQDLSAIFTKFKEAKVDEFVLDLRYNGGGYLNAAIHLASLLAPEKAVSQRDILIYKTWNAEYQKIYKNNTAEHFDNQVPAVARLDLSRLWVLTSQGTASASEVVISGLKPYINVYTIGDVTTGKNTGGSVFSDNTIKDKAAYIITMQYENKNKESVAGGVSPYRGYDTMASYRDTTDLGDPAETLLKIALEEIAKPTGRASSLETTATPGLQHAEPGAPGRLIMAAPALPAKGEH
jgi:hypothetical protein